MLKIETRVKKALKPFINLILQEKDIEQNKVGEQLLDDVLMDLWAIKLENEALVFEYIEKHLIPHKINVFESGIELLNKGVFKDLNIDAWKFKYNLVNHDLSKFSKEELLPYSEKFILGKKHIDFTYAWHNHKMKNPHHPEYWIDVNKEGKTFALDMPNIYIAEMIADWHGSGKSYPEPFEEFLKNNFRKFCLSAATLTSSLIVLEEIDKSINLEFLFSKTT